MSTQSHSEQVAGANGLYAQPPAAVSQYHKRAHLHSHKEHEKPFSFSQLALILRKRSCCSFHTDTHRIVGLAVADIVTVC